MPRSRFQRLAPAARRGGLLGVLLLAGATLSACEGSGLESRTPAGAARPSSATATASQPPPPSPPEVAANADPLPAPLREGLAQRDPVRLADTRLPRLGDLSPGQLEALAATIADWPRARRVAAFAFLMVGTPYVNGPLGEETIPDTDPVFATRPADCATVNLVAMALSHVPESGTPRDAMRWANYRDGRVDYASRLHFTTDRLDVSPYNVDWTREAAAALGLGAPLERAVTLNLKPDGTRWIPIDWERTRVVRYIPRDAARRLDRAWRDGKLPDAVGVAFVSERMLGRGLDVVHESLLWQGRTLLHGSSAAGRVTTVEFGRYLDEQQSRVNGVVIFEYR